MYYVKRALGEEEKTIPSNLINIAVFLYGNILFRTLDCLQKKAVKRLVLYRKYYHTFCRSYKLMSNCNSNFV